jgi:hypothetical protein
MKLIIIYTKIKKEIEKEICLRKLNQEKSINYTNNINIFIMTHKDFYNIITNQIYKIIADDQIQIKNKYSLQVIYANKGKLFKKSQAYGEMAKLYYIYELYKNGNLSSKYIGLNHYRRYFNFLDDIPDLDKLFENYDIILSNNFTLNISLEAQYCSAHLCKSLYETIEIIKELKPEYYNAAIESLKANDGFFFNMFIMKKEDFFKYCEFIYDILFEYDRRHNFISQKDIINYMKAFFPEEEIPFQMRLEGFLSERLSTIFFKHNFKRIKIFPIIYFSNLDINKGREQINNNIKNIFLIMIMNWILLLIKYYLNIFYFKKNKTNKI